MHIHIGQNSEEIAQTVAQTLQRLLQQHNESRPFCIALAGGSTPKQLYEVLAQPPIVGDVPWTRVAFFFGDERAGPPEHQDANYHMAQTSLLKHIPSRAYRMAAETGAAEAYAQLLKEHLPHNAQGIPSFDLVLLGMGTDGHTASLFPGTKALDVQDQWVVMNDVPQLETTRMTLTFPVLNASQRIWCLVTGERKRARLQECFHHPDANLPIQRLNPTEGTLTWWLDQAAAPQTLPDSAKVTK